MVRILSFIGICLIIGQIQAQSLTVWPGDVSDNGRVDYVDFLLWDQAYGTFGPPRLDGGDTWSAPAAFEWLETFPNGTNFAHADCNGDGIIDEFDFDVIFQNYGLVNDSLGTEPIQIGINGIDPPIFFDTTFFQYTVPEGFSVSVPIVLGTADLPVGNFSSVGFQVKFNPEHFEQLLVFPASPDSSFFQPFPFIPGFSSQPGYVDVILGVQDPSGFGQFNGTIAHLTGIIIEDLVGLTEQTGFGIED